MAGRITFAVVSIFPQMLQNWLAQGVVARALETGIINLQLWNPRTFSDDKHQRVDERPFGGGPGMVMQYPPLARTAAAIDAETPFFHVLLSPQGERFHHNLALALAEKTHIALWCGRYEGLDQRFIDKHINLEISIGNFVLSGGEIAAAIVLDAVSRFVPGVLGDLDSAYEDSFAQQLFDCPHYTKPRVVDTLPAPEILLSGNHAQIARWRLKQALGQTFLKRPELIEQLNLIPEQKALLAEFLREYPIGEP